MNVDSLAPRIAEKIQVLPSGCWRWTDTLDRDGYGRLRVGRRTIRAHRVVYGLLVAPVPDDQELDHECHNADRGCPGGRACLHRACVRPTHLEPRTGRQNKLRSPLTAASRNLAKTHCPKDHPYDETNTYVDPKGKRECRACKTAEDRRRRARPFACGNCRHDPEQHDGPTCLAPDRRSRSGHCTCAAYLGEVSA